MPEGPKNQSAETSDSAKEYTFQEFLKHFAPDVDFEVPEERSDTPSQIGRDIANQVLKELQENLAKEG